MTGIQRYGEREKKERQRGGKKRDTTHTRTHTQTRTHTHTRTLWVTGVHWSPGVRAWGHVVSVVFGPMCVCACVCVRAYVCVCEG